MDNLQLTELEKRIAQAMEQLKNQIQLEDKEWKACTLIFFNTNVDSLPPFDDLTPLQTAKAAEAAAALRLVSSTTVREYFEELEELKK